MIAGLLAIALATAIPLGTVMTAAILSLGDARTRSVVLLPVGLAIAALALPPGIIAAGLVVPWWLVTFGVGAAAATRIGRKVLARDTDAFEPWRFGMLASTGFLAVGSTWLVAERAGVQPFGFDRPIVLLTAVHFHVAGFVLTLAGSLAARRRPGMGIHIAILALVAGTPLTALGFFGLPIVSLMGACLVAGAGIAIGAATARIARTLIGRLERACMIVGGATLLLTMPLAVGYASGAAFSIPFLDIPAMAAIHGGLNVVGFAIPTMLGWWRTR